MNIYTIISIFRACSFFQENTVQKVVQSWMFIFLCVQYPTVDDASLKFYNLQAFQLFQAPFGSEYLLLFQRE